MSKKPTTGATLDPAQMTTQLNELLELVKLNTARVRSEMKARDADDGFRQEHVKAVHDLSKMAVEVSKEVRAWQKQNKELGKKLSMSERLELTVRFLQGLSAADLREIAPSIREVLHGV